MRFLTPATKAPKPLDKESITALLAEWREDPPGAGGSLMDRVYPQLRAMAALRIARDGPRATMEATELVHETYLRLARQHRVCWNGEGHFFKVAACIMRRVLVDRARSRNRQKRGGGSLFVSLSQVEHLPLDVGTTDWVKMDHMLDTLQRIHSRAGTVVELRVFTGLEVEEIARVLEVSPRTVTRDWQFAKAWLKRHMGRSEADGS